MQEAQAEAMSDKEQFGYDPANQAPAEGQSHPIPPEDKGKNPNIDPAAKDEPAEGGRDEVEGSAERETGREHGSGHSKRQ